MKENSSDTFDNVAVVVIIIILYGVINILSLVKGWAFLKSIKTENSPKLLWFFVIINLITICKIHVVRIIWSLNYFLRYSNSVSILLDSLSSATLSLLGLTFSLFWIQIYIDISLNFQEKTRNFLLKLALFSYYMILFVIYFIHVYDVYYNLFNSEHSKIVSYINALIALIVAALLLITGKKLNRKIRSMFTGMIGKKIIRRINIIIISSGIIYLLKCLVYVVTENFGNYIEGEVFGVVLVFVYLICAEIIPLSSILFYLKTDMLKHSSVSSSLPSGLLSSKGSSIKIQSYLFSLMTESEIAESYFSGVNNERRSTSMPGVVYQIKAFNQNLFRTAIN